MTTLVNDVHENVRRFNQEEASVTRRSGQSAGVDSDCPRASRRVLASLKRIR